MFLDGTRATAVPRRMAVVTFNTPPARSERWLFPRPARLIERVANFRLCGKSQYQISPRRGHSRRQPAGTIAASVGVNCLAGEVEDEADRGYSHADFVSADPVPAAHAAGPTRRWRPCSCRPSRSGPHAVSAGRRAIRMSYVSCRASGHRRQ